MNNIEAMEVLEKMSEDGAFTSAQNNALAIAINTIDLRIPKPPMYVKAHCRTCGREIASGQKICENCGQWILWGDCE